jgi:D-alanyl-D-alanine carboxypeptidase (penicillin-binding protein 5/6)
VDAVSGQVLYERNADTPRPMASTTKIMTALLFCEHVPDNAIITAGPGACAVKESSLHLKLGEKLTAHDLLRAILMRSANDACVDAAEFVAGNEGTFVQMMNDRAAALGCTHTHFMNPHGLHDPDHYTTARDLALIARAAVQEPRICEVVRTQHTRINRSIDKRDVTLYNHSRFLGRFPGADGIKTGWTVPAGKCYVGSVTQHKWRLISVVLKSPDYVHETALLMRYGFANFTPHVLAHAGDPAGECPLLGGTRPTIPAVVKSLVQVVLPKGDPTPVTPQIQYFTPSAPLSAGAVVGLYKGTLGDRVICSAPLIAAIPALRAPAPVPPVSGRANSRPWLVAASFFVLCLVSLRNGARITTFTKSARRRGRRIAKSLRGDHLAR